MASNPAMIIRVAATLAELKANLAEGKSQIETTTAAMGKLAASFSGDKLIQAAHNVTAAVNQIGGVSKLTEAEMARVNATLEKALEKYRVLGREAPAGMQALAEATRGATSAGEGWSGWLGKATGLLASFGIGIGFGALVSFTKGLVDSAGALIDLSQKTGLTTDTLQRFAAVGKVANVSVDDFATAAYKLGLNLAGGDKGVIKAVTELGLSWQKLRDSSPDEQFESTIRKLEGVENITERNRLGNELFGKSWAAIAPAVAKGYSDIADAAKFSSKEQLQALDDASDAWDAFLARQKTGLVSWLGNRVIASEQFAKLTEQELQAYAELGMKGGDTQQMLLDLARVRAKQIDIELVPAQAKQVALTKEEQLAAEKLAEAMVELNAAGVGWQGTLKGIDGEVVNAVRYYLEAGVSQSALARAYGLTDVQVKAVASSLEDAVKTTKTYKDLQETMWKQQLDLEGKILASTAKQTAAYLKLRNEGVMAELEAQTALNKVWGLDASGAIAHEVTAIETLETKLRELQILQDQGQDTTKRVALAQLEFGDALMKAAVADDTARNARAAGNTELAKTPAVAASAGSSIDSLADTFNRAAGVVIGGLTGIASAQVPRNMRPGENPIETAAEFVSRTIRNGRQSGGPVSAGSPYVVGERGPELFVPSQSGSIVPSGGGGMTSVTNIYITQPLGTPSAIAAAVKQALAEDHRSSGGRMPVGV